jgi:choline dehydrogenase
MVYMRGNHRDYDTWAYLGNERWSYKDVLPYFKKAEDQERGPDEYHGVNGPMRVSDIHPPNPATIAFADAAIQMGYRRNRDFNGRDQLGSGMVQVTIKYDPQNPDYSGRRVSSADAYLNPIKSRSNFTLKTNALVDSIVLEQKESKPVKASGVKYHLSDNVERVARARLEVIVCGGTVNSPKLLMLSGIGSGEHLRSLGIRPIVDLPGVGQNLQDHPLVAIGYRYSGGQKSKPPAAGAAEGSLFIHTRPAMEASAPDMQIHFAHWLLIDPQYLKLRSVAPDDGFAFVPTLVKPQGCGSITLRSSSPQDLPKIEPNYLQCDSDLEALLMAAKASRKLAHAKAFDPLRGDEVAPGVGCQTDDEWKQYIRLAAAALFHPVGSCKMGRDRMAVVDPRLRVHGVQGLRVVDASIMPIITSGNTHAPTVMIAEKAAQMIKDDQ